MNREEYIRKQIKSLQEELTNIRDQSYIQLATYLRVNGPMLFDDAVKKFNISEQHQGVLFILLKKYKMLTLFDFQRDKWIAHEDNVPKPKWR